MGSTLTGIVLAGIEPQQQSEVAELLRQELKHKVSGTVCIIPAPACSGSAREIAQQILIALEQSGIIAAPDDEPVYSAEEEEKIRKRLADLGYL